MEYTEELAEIVGIMLGDGCLYKEKKGNKYQTTITSHKQERPYVESIKLLFENYFGYKFCIIKIKSALQLRNGSKFIGERLIEAGLTPGNKVINKKEIPNWIFEDEKYILKVVKGLFDTDGSIYRKYAHYAQIEFKFGCFETTNSVRRAIKYLGYNPTKVMKYLNKAKGFWAWKFYLSRQGEIDDFFKYVNPRNRKHIIRFNKIRNGDVGIRTQI